MREHTVRSEDSPARIAIEYAGCPKCARDLVAANPHKEAVTYPNGFVTFKNLRAGERLNLPDKWFNGELDNRPKSYFAALPHPDGRTPSSLGLAASAGVLGDYGAFDAAVSTITSLAAMTPQSFSNAVDAACTMLDQSVQEADKSSNPGVAAYAQAVHLSTNAARQANQALVAALTSGDQAAIAKARADIQQNLATAIDAAKLALQSVYGGGSAPSTPATPPLPTIPQDTIKAVAQAVAAAVAADPNYCTSVAQAGSAMNTAIHAFKSAWNAANPGTPVPINTGTYEQATADAVARVLGSAPPACGARGGSSPSVPGGGSGGLTPPQPSEGMSLGAILGLSLLGAGAVGGAIYFATKDPPRRRARRSRPRRANPMIRREEDRDTVAPWRKS